MGWVDKKVRSEKARISFFVIYVVTLAHRTSFLCALAPVKILSKKEQKRLEDEEFERLMNEAGVTEAAKTDAAPKEESKQSAAESQAEVDEKKRLANQKKKEKKKAKAAAAKQ